MKKIYRKLSWLLLLAMLFGMLGTGVFAEDGAAVEEPAVTETAAQEVIPEVSKDEISSEPAEPSADDPVEEAAAEETVEDVAEETVEEVVEDSVAAVETEDTVVVTESLVAETVAEPTPTTTPTSQYGDKYDHIDVKVDGAYTVSVDGKDYTLSATLDASSIVVKVGSKTFSGFSYTRTEDGRYEYNLSTNNISPSDISWVNNTFAMSNVVVSAKMLFDAEKVPAVVKDYLNYDSSSGKYYVTITNHTYSGVQECTGGNGMRSAGKSGTPGGLDLYITAKDLSNYITKGKLGIEKVVVDQSGNTVSDNTEFSFRVTGSNYDKTVVVKAGEKVVLTDLAAGKYTITELQKDGYIVVDADGNATGNYSYDYVVETKQDSSIPVAVFKNTKLADKGGISLKKVSNGTVNPTVTIYKADNNGVATDEVVWTGSLQANGDTIYLKNYLVPGAYVLVETNNEIEGKTCEASISVNGVAQAGMTFNVTAGSVAEVVLTNTYTDKPATTSVTVTKKWDDGADNDGIRPEKITVTLSVDGEVFKSADISGESDTWTYTFTDVPVGEYTVTEGAVEGYSSFVDGLTITNTHAIEKTDYAVTKAWDDEDDNDGIRPEAVEVQLYATTEAYGKLAIGEAVELSEENDWTHTFEGLWVKYQGEVIDWSVEEVQVAEGYTASVTENASGAVITNTHEIETTEVTVTKEWDDADDQDGLRPEGITVSLKADGQVVAEAQITAEDGWTYTFAELPVYDNGEAVVYRVEEQLPEGYSAAYEYADGDVTITNKHTPETIDLDVVKKWIDNNDKEDKRPDDITVQLYANGEKYGDAVKLNKEGEWKYSFKDLPKYDGGVEIEYTVKEDAVKHYVAKYTTADGNLVITNTYADIPLTGDTMNLIFWTMMILGAGAALSVIGFRGFRKKA